MKNIKVSVLKKWIKKRREEMHMIERQWGFYENRNGILNALGALEGFIESEEKRQNPNHICSNIKYCSCNVLDLEPNEDCAVHGFSYFPPRCIYCGRFMKREKGNKK